MIPSPDAYPEQILAAAQDHIRALERRQRQLEAKRANTTSDRGPGSASSIGSGDLATDRPEPRCCGNRANTTTYHRRVEQVQFSQRPTGTFLYRDVAVVTYESDYVDPTLPDLSGRLTEVNRFVLTRGEAFVGVTTYHDFVGDRHARPSAACDSGLVAASGWAWSG
jgi:hypothetical protein